MRVAASLRWLLVLVALVTIAAACSGSASVAGSEGAVATPSEAAVEGVGEEPTELTTTSTSPPSTTTANVVTSDDPQAGESGLVLVSAAEIEAALRGNTIIGNWVGEDYRQFFDASGFTTYRPVQSGVESVGEWRVNDDTGLYESLWNDRLPWDEYQVHRDGDDWFWTGGGVERSPFTIVPGEQLVG